MVCDHGKLALFHRKEWRGVVMENEVVTISKFKATCLALLDKVKRTGQPILVTKRGEPIALVSSAPEPERPPSWLGSFRNKGKIVGDVVSPVLDESEWEILKQ
jgi:prevent-host-death family protein